MLPHCTSVEFRVALTEILANQTGSGYGPLEFRRDQPVTLKGIKMFFAPTTTKKTKTLH